MNQKRLQKLRTDLSAAWQTLDLDTKLAEIAQLEAAANEPEIWLNPEHAKTVHTKLARLNEQLEPWLLLRTQIEDLDELLLLDDRDLATEVEAQITALEQNFQNLKKSLRFTGKFDHNNAILRLTAGVGGTEAMDWAGMLERMYLRFAEKRHFKVQCLERTTSEEAGIKTAVYEIIGPDAYGLLKSEHGVHRLQVQSVLEFLD